MPSYTMTDVLPKFQRSSPEQDQWKRFRSQLRKLLRTRKSKTSLPSKIYSWKPQAYQKSTAEIKIIDMSPTSSRKCITPVVQRALIVARKGEYCLRDDHAVPELENEDEVMIRSCAVGLNPIDWKSVAYNFCLPGFPWITGREMSGVVERVGNNVTHLQPGDRVWTSTYYRDVRAGCFQEYVVVPKHTVLPIPGMLSFEEAAILGVGALTAAMTLWKWLNVSLPQEQYLPTPPRTRSNSLSTDQKQQSFTAVPPSPPQTPTTFSTSLNAGANMEEWLLVWGGSTTTGQFATQLAALSNIKTITICSARTASLSRSLGASHVIVRDSLTSSEILAEIASVTQGRITRCLDLVGISTASLCIQACSTEAQQANLQERQVIFAPLAMMSTKEIVPNCVRVETVEMKRFVLDTEAGVYGEHLNRIIGAGRLRLPELEVLEGGLVSVQKGLELVKKGDMGGRKVVVRL